jgi:hypothetical protein
MANNGSQATEISLSPKDDFKLIDGIGPGIEKRLQATGILTYAQLAAMTPEQVMKALGDMIGLTKKRITDKDWIGQARQLAATTPRDEPSDRESRQHYATFTIELLLDGENRVRRTRAVYIQEDKEETWASWDEARLMAFFTQHGDLNLSQSEATSPEEVEPEPVPMTAPTSLGGSVRLDKAKVISLQSGHPGRVLARNQPFEINLSVDLEELTIPAETNVGYAAQVFAKTLGVGSQQKIGEAHGDFTTADAVEMSVKNQGLEEGTYRIGVNLALSQLSTEPATQPEMEILLDGGLLKVF